MNCQEIAVAIDLDQGSELDAKDEVVAERPVSESFGVLGDGTAPAGALLVPATGSAKCIIDSVWREENASVRAMLGAARGSS